MSRKTLIRSKYGPAITLSRTSSEVSTSPRPGCDLTLITRSPAAPPPPLLPRPRKLQNAELIKSSISTSICRIHYLSKMPSIAFSPSPYIFGSKLLQALSRSQDSFKTLIYMVVLTSCLFLYLICFPT